MRILPRDVLRRAGWLTFAGFRLTLRGPDHAEGFGTRSLPWRGSRFG
jgi:hypothetical protein